jgi:hypothetical protein
VRFGCVTMLRVEGKQTHILRKPKTLATREMRQRATKYCHWEIMFTVWAVYASLNASPLAPLILLSFTSNESGARRLYFVVFFAGFT